MPPLRGFPGRNWSLVPESIIAYSFPCGELLPKYGRMAAILSKVLHGVMCMPGTPGRVRPVCRKTHFFRACRPHKQGRRRGVAVRRTSRPAAASGGLQRPTTLRDAPRRTPRRRRRRPSGTRNKAPPHSSPSSDASPSAGSGSWRSETPLVSTLHILTNRRFLNCMGQCWWVGPQHNA